MQNFSVCAGVIKLPTTMSSVKAIVHTHSGSIVKYLRRHPYQIEYSWNIAAGLMMVFFFLYKHNTSN